MLLALAIGPALTTTLVVATDTQPFAPVTVTLYLPPIADVALATSGFCCVLVKPFGPLHASPLPHLALKFMLDPVHTGLLLLALATGPAVRTTLVVATDTQPFAPVTVTLYVPPIADVAFAITGFCCVELKPFGPLHA